MTTLAALRAGLAANLSTINGLRAVPYVPDNVEPPMAVVNAPTITYDTAFQRGSDEYTFTVDVYVSAASLRGAQLVLDDYVDPAAVKAALESDRSLGGAAMTLRVTSMNSYRQEVVGDIPFLAASFSVQVVAA